MDMNRPIHIVMTPTRNEAWVIRAFLECNGLWADYIIVADQMSTDGTREIIADYIAKSEVLRAKNEECPHRAEVIMIDNTNPEFNEAERQSMLVAKAREVAAGRDILLWGLDADEIVAANAFETADWQKIMHSKPGAVFWFQWAQLTHDKQHYYNPPAYYPWLFHDDGVEPHGNYVRAMHSMRIPYPIDEHDMTYINDFRVLHLGPTPLNRVRAKERFYMFVDWQVNHRPPYTMGRNYIGSNAYPAEQFDLPEEWIYTMEKDGWSLWENVELDEQHCWMDDYIYERLDKYPMKTLIKIPLWTPEFMNYYHIIDPRPWYVRLVHRYVGATQKCKSNIIVRGIDKMLRKFVKE